MSAKAWSVANVIAHGRTTVTWVQKASRDLDANRSNEILIVTTRAGAIIFTARVEGRSEGMRRWNAGMQYAIGSQSGSEEW